MDYFTIKAIHPTTRLVCASPCLRPDTVQPTAWNGILLFTDKLLVWGINWPLFHFAVREVSVWTFRAAAVLVAGIALLSVAKLRGQSLAIPRRFWFTICTDPSSIWCCGTLRAPTRPSGFRPVNRPCWASACHCGLLSTPEGQHALVPPHTRLARPQWPPWRRQGRAHPGRAEQSRARLDRNDVVLPNHRAGCEAGGDERVRGEDPSVKRLEGARDSPTCRSMIHVGASVQTCWLVPVGASCLGTQLPRSCRGWPAMGSAEGDCLRHWTIVGGCI